MTCFWILYDSITKAFDFCQDFVWFLPLIKSFGTQNTFCKIQKYFSEIQKRIIICKLLADKNVDSLIDWDGFITTYIIVIYYTNDEYIIY